MFERRSPAPWLVWRGRVATKLLRRACAAADHYRSKSAGVGWDLCCVHPTASPRRHGPMRRPNGIERTARGTAVGETEFRKYHARARARSGLGIGSLWFGGRRDGRVHHEGDDGGGLRNEFVQEFDAFGGEHAAGQAHAREIAAWPIEAANETGPDRKMPTTNKHDWNGLGCSLGGERRRGAALVSR
jgi:hypothetical protein